jgi:hypothetical protein
MATKTKAVKAVATTVTEDKKGFAPFKQSDDAYLVFGNKAMELSGVLGLEPSPIKGGTSVMLKIELDDFEAIKATLEAANYDVKVETMKTRANIKTFKGGAIVFGDPDKEENAAVLVANALELTITMTNSEKPSPMVRLTEAQLTDAIALLEENGYYVNILSGS